MKCTNPTNSINSQIFVCVSNFSIPAVNNFAAMFDNIKLITGKRKVSLGNVACIQNKEDKYILDLTTSPNVSHSAMRRLVNFNAVPNSFFVV